MFEGLITLQIENGDVKLKNQREHCPRNATYECYATGIDLLGSISTVLESNLLSSLSTSTYFSLMAMKAPIFPPKKSFQYVHDGCIKRIQLNTFLELCQQRKQLLKLLLDICTLS